MAVSYTTMSSPIGRLWLAVTEKGVCRIGLPYESREMFLAHLAGHTGLEPLQEETVALAAVVIQLREYFSRLRRAFEVPLDLRGTRFQRAVWTEVAAIPYGVTVTYGEIARRLGRGPASARAVGAAVGANPVPIIVPCHRVIGADGALIGYGGGLGIKAALLRLEGVRLAAVN
ncbi:MAG TPA: methylated-DNA--[protein]-cysteine S-methyltransferase [Chloroflexi bacterium]|nr:methylated-DNA--[protein]-cysteine S-methyltransferase [Chloroflexota bacterium]